MVAAVSHRRMPEECAADDTNVLGVGGKKNRLMSPLTRQHCWLMPHVVAGFRHCHQISPEQALRHLEGCGKSSNKGKGRLSMLAKVGLSSKTANVSNITWLFVLGGRRIILRY